MTKLEGKVGRHRGERGIAPRRPRMLADQGRERVVSRSATSASPTAVARPTDVRDRAQLGGLVDETVRRHGGLDIVVANAGVGAYGPFVELAPGAHRTR